PGGVAGERRAQRARECSEGRGCRGQAPGSRATILSADLDEIFAVNAVSIGYVSDLSHGNKVDISLGGQFTIDFWPGELDRYYGSGPGYGFEVFLRIRPSRHDHSGMQMDEPSPLMPK